MANIYFVRHGETDWNEDDRLRGWSEIPLNEAGQREALETANAMRGMKVIHITAADLPRVIQTATPIAKATKAPLTLDPRYRDLDYGEWTGVPVKQVLPKMVKIFKAGKGTPPGGQEDYAEMKDRLGQAAKGLFTTASQHNQGDYVVVSSNRTVRTLLSYVTDDPKWEIQSEDPIPNTGLLRFAQDPKLPGYGVGEPAFKKWGYEQVQTKGRGKGFGFQEE